jgi:hypothetical protein
MAEPEAHFQETEAPEWNSTTRLIRTRRQGVKVAQRRLRNRRRKLIERRQAITRRLKQIGAALRIPDNRKAAEEQAVEY